MEQNQDRFARTFRLTLSVLASIAYLGGGIALITSSQSFGIAVLTGPLRYALAALLLAYGSFRAFRSWQQFREDR